MTLEEAELNIGSWLSAALDDDLICDGMKTDILNWFAALEERDKTDRFDLWKKAVASGFGTS